MLLLILLMMRALSSFLLNLHYPYTFTSPLQKTLNQNQRASHSFYSVKDISKTLSIQLAFKWVFAWNRVIRGHVCLLICLNEIQLNSFDLFQHSLFNIFIQTIPMIISTSLGKLSFFLPQIFNNVILVILSNNNIILW